jgi:hypothetical protein
MTREIYGQPGNSMPQVGGTCPDGWVVMQGERPTPNHVANADGEWVLPPAPIPQTVTPAQGLMALYSLKGITDDDIQVAIGSIEDPALRYQAQISYKKATVWERTSVSWQVLAGLLGLTESDQDELLALAATYTNL